jgi:hypothetical protein
MMKRISAARVGSTWWQAHTEEQRTHLLVLPNLYFDSGRRYSPEETDSFGWCRGDLFTRICGVRGENSDIEPVTALRGLPEDVNEITKMIYDYDGGPEYTHSAGRLTRPEMRKVGEWYETQDCHRQGGHHGFEGVFGYLCGNPLYSDDQKLFEDVWIVFWFDN